jgi:hypothetical protein
VETVDFIKDSMKTHGVIATIGYPDGKVITQKGYKSHHFPAAIDFPEGFPARAEYRAMAFKLVKSPNGYVTAGEIDQHRVQRVGCWGASSCGGHRPRLRNHDAPTRRTPL